VICHGPSVAHTKADALAATSRLGRRSGIHSAATDYQGNGLAFAPARVKSPTSQRRRRPTSADTSGC